MVKCNDILLPPVSRHPNECHLRWSPDERPRGPSGHSDQSLHEEVGRCAICFGHALEQDRVDAQTGCGVGSLSQQTRRKPTIKYRNRNRREHNKCETRQE